MLFQREGAIGTLILHLAHIWSSCLSSHSSSSPVWTLYTCQSPQDSWLRGWEGTQALGGEKVEGAGVERLRGKKVEGAGMEQLGGEKAGVEWLENKGLCSPPPSPRTANLLYK